MREYSEALEQCRTALSGKRESNELRAEFFLIAIRYGREVYPSTRDFIDEVRFTMSRLGAIDNEKDMIQKLEIGVKECKNHQRSGKRLEAQHDFVAAKLKGLKDKFKDTKDTLTQEQQTILDEVEAMESKRFWQRFGPSKGKKERAEQRREEANMVMTALVNIRLMRECCVKVLEVVHFINNLLGNCVSEIGEIVRQFAAFKATNASGEGTSEIYFSYLKTGIRELEAGLIEFGDGRSEYISTLTVIEINEPPNRTDVINWNRELKEFLEKEGDATKI